jgi:uncharacterized protein (TIGR02588 family)
MGERERSKEKGSGPPAIEWAVAAVGFLLVAGSIGILVYEALTRNDTPPAIVVDVDQIHPTEGGHLVLLRIRNTGGQTAEGLVVEGELRQGDQTVERSETTIDYAPARSERKGGLFFTRDPSAHEIHLRPLGFEEP